MVPIQSALNSALNGELPLERVAEVATKTRGRVPFVFTAAQSFTPNEAHRTSLFGGEPHEPSLSRGVGAFVVPLLRGERHVIPRENGIKGQLERKRSRSRGRERSANFLFRLRRAFL